MLRPDTFGLTALLGLLTAMGPLSTDMYLPSMPQIGDLFNASIAQVQFTLSAYLVVFAVSQLLYGPVSDRVGRKPVLLACLAVYILGSIGCAAAQGIAQLIVARCVQALGAAGTMVLARAIVRDLYEGARAARELALMGAVFAFGPIIAPVIGGILQSWFHWRAVFLVSTSLGIVALVTVWYALAETLRQQPGPSSVRQNLSTYAMLARHSEFATYTVMVALNYAGMFAWISGSSFVLQDLYGLSSFGFGVAFAIGAAGFLIGSFTAGRLIGRLGMNTTLGVGAAASAFAGLLMVGFVALDVRPAASLILPMTLYMAGLGIAMPQAIASAMQPFPRTAGSASSLIGFAQMTTGAIAGVVVGHTLGATAWPLVLAIAAMGAATFAVWLMRRRNSAASSRAT